MMVEQQCLENPKVDAIFGLHITSIFATGSVGYRSGPFMASADDFRVFIRGNQTHAAMPWRGVDPIVVGAQIVMGLQTIVSRRMNITKEPSVVTVGVFQGGVRHNIIPDEVKLEGTIRSVRRRPARRDPRAREAALGMIAEVRRRQGASAHPSLVRRDREPSGAHGMVGAHVEAHRRATANVGRRRQSLRGRGFSLFTRRPFPDSSSSSAARRPTRTPTRPPPTTARASTWTRPASSTA
jgi:amidohydrolase